MSSTVPTRSVRYSGAPVIACRKARTGRPARLFDETWMTLSPRPGPCQPAGPPLVKIAPAVPAGNDGQLVSGGTTARIARPDWINQLRPSLARLIVTLSNPTGWFA